MGVRSYIRARSLPSWQTLGLVAEQAIMTGGLHGLVRGRIAAIGVQAVLIHDSDAAATVAFSNGLLASDYGFESTEAALVAADKVWKSPRSSIRAQSLQLTARALVNIARGDFNQAEKQSLEAVVRDHEQPAPVFALGRARYRQGNLEGARRAFQAALVREPDFIEARVALAEVLLDGGKPALAFETLMHSPQKILEHSRAQLVIAQIQAVHTSVEAQTDWLKTCRSDHLNSPHIAALCDLVQAEVAWGAHDFPAVVRHAANVERHRPVDPRVLSRASQLLASLGLVDQANRFLQQATRMASSLFPGIRWGYTAVELGRGRLVEMPTELALSSSLIGSSMMTRIALASAGMEALEAAMASLQKDQDLRVPIVDSFALFLRTKKDAKLFADVRPNDPTGAYVKGLQARLAGDLPVAFQWLARALAEHGDACRAAGEFLAVCHALARTPARDAFEFIKTKNKSCINLPAALAALDAPKGKSLKTGRRAPREPKDLE